VASEPIGKVSRGEASREDAASQSRGRKLLCGKRAYRQGEPWAGWPRRSGKPE
jgi:hypothetical protein